MEELIMSFVGAAIAGGVYAAVSYFKNKQKDDLFKGFNVKSFIVTVLGSAIISVVAMYGGVTPDVVSSSLAGPFIYQALRKAITSF